jgi:hypothetical protein
LVVATPTVTETLAEAVPPTATPTATEIPAEAVPPTATPTATEIPAEDATPMPAPTATETPVEAASPTPTPAATETPVEAETPTPTPTETPVEVETPTPTPTQPAPPTATLTPTATPFETQVRVQYVCGYERCRDSAEYGELIFETEIEVWASSDPDDDLILYTVDHHQEMRVVAEQRLWEGPGGLWLEILGGGWISDFWLTDERCTPDNLAQYSFADCMLGEY